MINSMLNQIVQIFDKTSFKEGIERYFALGRQLGMVPLHGDVIYHDALIALNRLYVMEHVYRKDVMHVIDLFHIHSVQDTRTAQLYSYLGEMLCYWFIKEYGVVCKLQNDVKLLKYGSSWWERNKRSAAALAGGLLGALMALASGGAVSVGQGSALGGKYSGDTVTDHAELEQEFNILKEAIISVNFNVENRV